MKISRFFKANNIEFWRFFVFCLILLKMECNEEWNEYKGCNVLFEVCTLNKMLWNLPILNIFAKNTYSLNLNQSISTDYQWNLTDFNSWKEVTVNQSNFIDYFSEKYFFHWWISEKSNHWFNQWKFDWFRFREYIIGSNQHAIELVAYVLVLTTYFCEPIRYIFLSEIL